MRNDASIWDSGIKVHYMSFVCIESHSKKYDNTKRIERTDNSTFNKIGLLNPMAEHDNLWYFEVNMLVQLFRPRDLDL